MPGGCFPEEEQPGNFQCSGIRIRDQLRSITPWNTETLTVSIPATFVHRVPM